MNRRRFIEATAWAGMALAAKCRSAWAGENGGRGMQYVMFSKSLREQTIEQMIESLKRVGADGVDLTVRPGHPVTPENAATELAPAAERIRAAGLVIPMVTAPTELTNAGVAFAEPLFGACGDAGVPLIKVGYWPAPTDRYWQAVDRMKADVESLARLGEKHAVKPLMHTHSGRYMALNAAALMHVLKGFDPARVGAYVDVGHLAICGEPPALAFAMTQDWLSAVAVKDLTRVRAADGKTSTPVVMVGEGFVDWGETAKWLVDHDFRGPLSFHSEFESPTMDQRLEQTGKEIAFVRHLERKCRA